MSNPSPLEFDSLKCLSALPLPIEHKYEDEHFVWEKVSIIYCPGVLDTNLVNIIIFTANNTNYAVIYPSYKDLATL